MKRICNEATASDSISDSACCPRLSFDFLCLDGGKPPQPFRCQTVGCFSLTAHFSLLIADIRPLASIFCRLSSLTRHFILSKPWPSRKS